MFSALFRHGTDRRAYLQVDRLKRFQLMEAVRQVARGGSLSDPRAVDTLVQARLRAERSPVTRLSQREKQVLAGIAQGKSNAAIAQSLFLTKRAVEKHIHSIFTKLRLDSNPMISRRVTAARLHLADSELSLN
jgi:DNA-binding NarL/FixJ family response regulator